MGTPYHTIPPLLECVGYGLHHYEYTFIIPELRIKFRDKFEAKVSEWTKGSHSSVHLFHVVPHETCFIV